jgi:1-acyl-sn-glycerol-3-phosphate acyltransferase
MPDTVSRRRPANAMSLLIAGIRSLTAYLFLCVWVALAGPPALLGVYLTGRVRHMFALGRFGAKTARQLLGLRIAVEGLHHVDGHRPTVYCINHLSNIDVLVFEVLLPKCPGLRAMHKAELRKLPILGTVMRTAGFVPVERGNRDRAFDAVDEAVDGLRAGASFLLAPEGTRSRTGELQPFKKGAFVMAIKAQVPVVPIALIGPDIAMPRGQWYVKPMTVGVRIGAPIPTTGLTLADRDSLAARTRDAMSALLTAK